MVGHERPAGGHEMLGGSPLANAACRVFPKQAISEIEALYERRNLADLRPVLQDSTPIPPGSTQARIAKEAGQSQLPHVGQFPVPLPRIVLKSVPSPSA
jgi:hypothetical protein